ncbi:MAG: PP2C family protein-serine/threonine phosphatase [Blastocatellia bacterium]
MPNSRKSQFPLTELIKSLLPITPMGKAMCAGVVVWFIDWVFVEGDRLFGSSLLKKIVDFGSALAFIPFFYFLFKGASWVKEHLLWRLRRRLLVTYLLIGALPLLLLAFLTGLIGYAFATQSSVGVVSRKLDSYLEQSRAVSQSISRDLSGPEMSKASTDDLRRKLQERANALAAIFPDIRLSVRRGGQAAETVTVQGVAADSAPAPVTAFLPNSEAPLPPWLDDRESFHGLVLDEQPARQVYASHFIKSSNPTLVVFQLSYPIGRALCVQLGRPANLEVRPGLAYMTAVMTPNGPDFDNTRVADPEYLQRGGFPIFKPVTAWSSGDQMEREALLLDPSFMMPSHIWWRVQEFKTSGVIGTTVFLIISILSVFLLLIALGAIVSALFLTRSITGAVHQLYEGTKRVEVGDLDHEIPITGQDQLGELTGSFNRMTRSIRELLRVSAAKQRLDQEMKIAAEVQSRLFPRALPETAALDFAPGICIPARAVSGDYYDFFAVAPGRIGVVVADVCGKGVSAALMMANLQANLRGQVQAYHDAYDYQVSLAAHALAGDAAAPRESQPVANPVRRIVERVNQQLASAMIDASYITFFYAEFNEHSLALRYTNAGHNPPLLYRRNGARIERLDRGGTVLGLFRDVEYEDVELRLETGDVLVAFTDGLIEARSPGGEEFGEDRVIQSLQDCAHLTAARIEQHLLETVRRWTADAEQEDDLTLVIFKVK